MTADRDVPDWASDPVMCLEGAYYCALAMRALYAQGHLDQAMRVANGGGSWLVLMQLHSGLSQDWCEAMVAARVHQGGPVHPDVVAWIQRKLPTPDAPTTVH